jgi:polysaccharide biosynthesis transport protein
VADSFRAILASIFLSTGNGSSPSVIVLTSPSAQEGKTTSATNLAVALAAIGKNVLLVDSDLRKPRLHEIFGLRNERGFSDLLAEQGRPDKAPISTYVQPTSIAGLSVLTSGRKRNTASNLLYAPCLSELFDRLRRNFDAVLVDTPPMLPVADARVLGRSADGVVLVCRAGATDRERAKIAIDRLFADGARVLGTILNDFDPRHSSYYGKYYARNYSGAPDDGDLSMD